MADIIHVSTEELRNAVSKYNTCKSQLQIAYLTMSNAVRTVDTTWNGDASEAFKAQFDLTYKNLEQTEEKVQDAVDELTQAADIYDEIEQTNTSTFQGLDQGTSPFDS
ncbi:MAG: WXG100 family type VII secretion target [Oscillospiraceae bacterium]|nr:WXG100 family type VII secretion target [Oscillospiraceae bacterium]